MNFTISTFTGGKGWKIKTILDWYPLFSVGQLEDYIFTENLGMDLKVGLGIWGKSWRFWIGLLGKIVSGYRSGKDPWGPENRPSRKLVRQLEREWLNWIGLQVTYLVELNRKERLWRLTFWRNAEEWRSWKLEKQPGEGESWKNMWLWCESTNSELKISESEQCWVRTRTRR